ncbi:hypothetical protein FB446DRAFT_607036, partial [Lentinula raphanica]
PIQPVSSYMSPLRMLSAVSSRSIGGVSPSTQPSSSPFQSITAIERANNTRLDHAAQVLGNSSSTRRKKRGPGKKAPRLHGAAESAKIEDSISVADDGREVVNLVVLVYPPRLSPDECHTHAIPLELHHYVQNGDAFEHVLNNLGLSHYFDNLPLDTKVVDLLETLRAFLVQRGWIFPDNPSQSLFGRHERLAIQLLRFTSKGNINNNAKTPRLIPAKVESEDMTLRQIVTNTNDYGIAKFAITNSKKFILHTIVRSANVSLNVNLSEKHLGSDDTTRRHFCISKRIYGIFRSDTDA